jgi:hypothetical protein
MLSTFETNVFSALRHDSGRTGAASDDGSDRCAFAATGNRSDDRADAGRCTDFRCVVLRRVLTFHATFRIDLWILAANLADLDQLSV